METAVLTALSYLLAALAATPAALRSAVPGVQSPVPIEPTIVYHPPSWGEQHMPVLIAVQTLFIVCAIGLVAAMSVQTTKNEGLSGSVGGRVESAYHGRLGLDEQLKRLTSWLAIGFFVLAVLYFFITR